MTQVPLDRRQMLIGAGAAALAGSVQSAHAVTAKARWAIVGLGSFAVGQMMPAFSSTSNSVMTAFVSGTPAKQVEQGAKYGVSRFYNYTNFDTIESDPDIDCVYIALPVSMHAEYTLRALKAGKHVLCEKPMASTVAECEAMIAAAKAAGKQLGVAYRCHFEPHNVEAVRRLRAGEIGTLRYVSGDAGFSANPDYPPHKWRLQKAMAGGGSMYDIGIYALNAALWAVDEAPVSVSAVYSTPRDDDRFREVEGGVEWRLRFASGISAQGSSSYAYQYNSRHLMFGSESMLQLNPSMDYYNIKLFKGSSAATGEAIDAGKSGDQFANQIRAFSTAAMTNTPHLTSGEMGLRDVRLIQAMYQSADNNGVMVSL